MSCHTCVFSCKSLCMKIKIRFYTRFARSTWIFGGDVALLDRTVSVVNYHNLNFLLKFWNFYFSLFFFSRSVFKFNYGRVSNPCDQIVMGNCEALSELLKSTPLKSISYKKGARNQGCTKFAKNCPMSKRKQNMFLGRYYYFIGCINVFFVI